MEAFYPQNSAGYTIPYFSNFNQALPIINLVLSLIASSLGMSKFFLNGPLPILANDSPINGLVSLPFLCLLLINSMFGVRVVCIENAFFSSYRYQHYHTNGIGFSQKIIEPIISPEYRLLAYFTPSLISFTINIMRLTSTRANLIQYVRKYPQILVACGFTPFMFESSNEKEKSIRIWKFGTILNAFFIGCLPQIVLLVMDFYRGVTDWSFISIALETEHIYENNDALFKSRFGNSIFAVISCVFFFCLIILFFMTDRIFKNCGMYCRCFSIMCFPCPQNCSNLSNQLPSTQNFEFHHSSNGKEVDLDSKEKFAEDENETTHIFVYTRDSKIWFKGEAVNKEEILEEKVIIMIHYFLHCQFKHL